MADVLRIHRARARYRLPAGTAGSAAQTRLDAVLRERLGESLAAMMPDGRDDGVWIVRRLKVRSAIAADGTSEQIARRVARSVSKALTRTLDAGPDADEVLWYPSRAAYLAAFLLDCAEGRAFGRGRYFEWEDLSGRSMSAALREALDRRPEESRAALSEMLPAEPEVVARQLTAQDAESTLDALAGTGGHLAAAAASRELLESGKLPTERHATAWAVFVAALRSGVQIGAGVAREVAAVAELMRKAPPPDRVRLAGWVASADLAGIARKFGGRSAARLAGLVSWPESDRRRLAEVFEPRSRSSAAGAWPNQTETRFGGAFLLLPLMNELEWAEGLLPACQGMSGTALLRFLAVIVASGGPANSRAFEDPLLRSACGVPEGLSPEDIAAWGKAVRPGAVQAFRAVWLEDLTRKGALGGERSSFRVGRDTVQVDSARGLWVDATGAAAPQAEPGSREAREWVAAALDASFALPAHARRLVALTSQNLLRVFAWHLAGFSRSSLPYLLANFLDLGASMSDDGERFVVSLDRPPLHLVLNATSLPRRTFRLPATGGKLWVTTQR